MSNAIFPHLPGLKWDVKRTPRFKTLIQKPVSGKAETRISLWSAPEWQWSLSYEFLRSDTAYAEWQTLCGFYLARQGALDTFLYTDRDDNSVAKQIIGSGDGSTKTFQLCRSVGGYTEVLHDINNLYHVYVNNVEQESGWSVNGTGQLTFSSAPPDGHSIAATFSYYWRVRFLDDEIEFTNFMYKFWELKKVEFVSARV